MEKYTEVLYDHWIPIKLKGKCFMIAITPIKLYGIECKAIKKQYS